MAEMAITPQQYEASMRRHGTREWTNEDERVTRQYREENSLGEFAPEPEPQADADSQRTADQRPEPKSDADEAKASASAGRASVKSTPAKATAAKADDGK